MNDRADTLEPSSEKESVTALTGSSAPGRGAPTFDPVVSVPAGQPSVALGQPDPVYALIETHQAAYAAWRATGADGADLESGPLSEAEAKALIAVAEAEPTTIPGLRRWISYVAGIVERDGDWTLAENAMPAIGEAVEKMLWSVDLSCPRADSEILKHKAELDLLMPQLKNAYNERYRLEAIRDANLPHPPPELIVDQSRRFEDGVEAFTAYTGDELGTQYYTAKAIDRLRAKPRFKYLHEPHPDLPPRDVFRRSVPDPDAQARAERVIAAFEGWEAECQACPEGIEHAVAVARHLDLDRRYGELMGAIGVEISSSLQGLAAQAGAMMQATDPQLLMAVVAEGLEEFAKAERACIGVVPALGGTVDPFIGYHREILALHDAIDAAESDEATGPLMDHWGSIDRLAMSSMPTTLAGALGCLEYARREHLQFRMQDGDGGDKGDRLILHLLDGALDVLRRVTAADPAARLAA